MSWNPLKRHSKPLSNRPILGPVNEKNLEDYITQFNRLETSAKKLHKDSKKYEDIMLALYQCEKKITSDLTNGDLCKDHDQLRNLVEDWLSFASEMDSAVEDHIVVTRRCLVDPIKRFQGVFSEVHTAVKKRDQAVQETNKLQQKVSRLEGKEMTGSNLAKLCEAKKALDAAQNEVKVQNSLLATELPQLYQDRLKYFQPSLEAFIHSQVLHWGEATSQFKTAFSTINELNQSESDMTQLQQQRLASLRALSIVGEV